MNDAWGNDDNQNESGPKALREAYEKQKKANEDLAQKVAALEQQMTKTVVADLIEAQGVKRSAAQYYTGDPDPEKVTAWVNDIRDAVGVPVSTETTVEPVLNATDMEQYQRLTQAGHGGTPVGSNADSLGAALNDAKSPAEMIAAFQKFGR